jgi:hypothetical protein
LCGVPTYASAKPLDLLARTKNPRFPIQKALVSHPEFPDGNYLSRNAIMEFMKGMITVGGLSYKYAPNWKRKIRES